MRLTILLTTIVSSIILTSCIKHEIIPAPEHKATLKAYFNGSINSTNVEFTENVNGYYGKTSKSQLILPGGQTSSAVYFFEMKSTQTNSSIQVGLGSISWDAGVSAGPSLSTFNTFFNNKTLPSYSDNGTNGFTVIYKDVYGNAWTSKQNSVNSQNVLFSNVNQESDPNGDYSKFNCSFSCYVYRSYGNPSVTDSLYIQNAQLKGWFSR